MTCRLITGLVASILIAPVACAAQSAGVRRVGVLVSQTWEAEVFRRHLPVMSYRRQEVRAGALLAYAVDRTEPMRRVALHVDRIIRGGKPAELPVEQPTKLELTINPNTARALGLTIPPSVLLRANEGIP